MAAKGEDSLTKIQKYKAALVATRPKGGQEIAKKPSKKKWSKKENAKTASESDSPASSCDLVSSENDNANPQATDQFNLSKESKSLMTGAQQDSTHHSNSRVNQACSSELPTMSDKEMNEEPERTSVEVGERPDNDYKEDEQEKPKKRTLSFRRKRKKSKSSQESEVAAQEVKKDETTEKEKQPDEETPKKEIKSDADITSSPSDESSVTESPVAAEDKKGSPDNDSKEKISKTKKFKRWASFSKQKKEAVGNNESTTTGGSQITKESEIEQKAGDVEVTQLNSSESDEVTKENDAEQTANSSPLSKEERRKRSVSFAENVKYHDDEMCAEHEPRRRSVSFSGEETSMEQLHAGTAEIITNEPKEASSSEDTEQQLDGDQDNSATTSTIEQHANNDGIQDSFVPNEENNDNSNEVEHDTDDIEQREPKTDDELAGDVTAGDTENESQDQETKPKKKKKRFLRKLSSRNLKSKDKTHEEKKAEISSPLLINDEPAANEEPGEQSEPEDKSKENSLPKRKKSVLGLKLPKALKKRKQSSEYKPITGAEVEKEMKKDEEQQKRENSENQAEEEVDVSKDPKESNEDVNKDEGPAESTTEEREEMQKRENSENQAEEEVDVSKDFKESNEDVREDEGPEKNITDGREKICENEVQKDVQELELPNDKPSEDQQNNSTQQDDEKEEDSTEEPTTLTEPTVIDEEATSHTTIEPSKIEEEEIPQSDQQATETTEHMDEEEDETTSLLEDNTIESNVTIEPENQSLSQYEYSQDDIDSMLTASEVTLIEIEEDATSEDKEQESAQPPDIHELPNENQQEAVENQLENSLEPTESNHLQTDEIHVKSPNEEHIETEEIAKLSSESSKESDRDSKQSSESMPSVSRPLSPDVYGRGFEMSVSTKAMVDTYILIDRQLEMSQDFLRQVELMDNHRSRCFVM